MKFKHLTADSFSHNPYQQPSMEGLWGDLKDLFSSNTEVPTKTSSTESFPYHLSNKVEEFFFELEKQNPQFKTDLLPLNHYLALFVKKGKPFDNIVREVEKFINDLRGFFQVNKSNDQKFSTLVKKVSNETKQAKSNKELEEILDSYKNDLYQTPVVAFKNFNFFSIKGSDFIGTKGRLGKQPKFLPNIIYEQLKQQRVENGIPCYAGDVKTIRNLALKLIDLNRVLFDFGNKLCFDFPKMEDIPAFKTEPDDGFGELLYFELLHLCGDMGKHRHYVCQVLQFFVLETLAALCYWIRESMIHPKNI